MSWDYKINIKPYLGEGEEKEDMLAAIAGIKTEIGKLPPGITRPAYDVVRTMEKAAEAEEIDWFNASLGRLYDWADEYRIWMGI